jgi:hypothetical protein
MGWRRWASLVIDAGAGDVQQAATTVLHICRAGARRHFPAGDQPSELSLIGLPLLLTAVAIDPRDEESTRLPRHP